MTRGFLALVLTLAAFSSAWAQTGLPVSWFLAPYKTGSSPYIRVCGMNDFTADILSDGGQWKETEILGNWCLVKVKASAVTLTTIAGTYRRIPASKLDDPLISLTNAQKIALRNMATDAGYTLTEMQDALGDLSTATLADLLRFLATRRVTPRYDAATQTIIFDGPVRPCRSIDAIDKELP